jgi:phage repressor protein C with HTH and peptisase S24 domain
MGTVHVFAHHDIWRAIDKLAAARGLSVSGLARRAGLDPTTFNKSKRVTRGGKPRWPSTESVSKVLQSVEASISEFAALLADEAPMAMGRLPLIDLESLRAGDKIDGMGIPAGPQRDAMSWPQLDDPQSYAVALTDSKLAPPFRSGDVLVVSPREQARRGDRVLLKTSAGDVLAMQIARLTADHVELVPIDGGPSRTLAVGEVAWMHRIVWASQ